MTRLFLPALISLLFFACGNEGSGEIGEAASATLDEATQAPDQALAAQTTTAPPPPTCVYLTEATVLSFFDETVKLPMAGQRSAAEYASCQYDLEAPNWSAALVLEMPEPGSGQQAIVDEVAGAKGSDAVELFEASGRFSNEGRILSVAGKKHFRLKFSALPKKGTEPPFDEAGRRKLLVEMAQGVLAI